MFALFLAWVTIGMATVSENAPSAKTAATAITRDWTDASGSKHVRAVLLRREGDKLWFRRADGKLSFANMSQLSPADRQYVATTPIANTAQPQPESKLTSLATAAVSKIGDRVQSMVELPQWTKSRQSENQSRLVPAALLYVRVSKDFLEDYVERAVHRTKPVTDNILGARIAGESDTRGKTTLQLLPGKGRLLGKITFAGTVHSQTRGYKSPVVLHQVSDSTFRSTKLILLDANGLRVSRATTNAPTNLRTIGIDTSLPRLRGRIASRIAWSRVAGSHQQAESITAQHTAANIGRDFDERVEQSVAKMQEAFMSKVPQWDRGHQSALTEMRFRSSADCVEVAMVRREANTEERNLRPPIVEGNPDVAVRVHRAMLTRAVADPQVRDNWGPAFIEALNARFGQNENASSKTDKKSSTDTTKLAFDLDWLVMDFMDSTN